MAHDGSDSVVVLHSTTVSTFLIPTHITTIYDNYTLFAIRQSMGHRICPLYPAPFSLGHSSGRPCGHFLGPFSFENGLPTQAPSIPHSTMSAQSIFNWGYSLLNLYADPSRGVLVVSMIIVRLSHFSLFPISGLQVVCPPQPGSVTLQITNRSGHILAILLPAMVPSQRQFMTKVLPSSAKRKTWAPDPFT